MNDEDFEQREAVAWRRQLPTFYYHTHFREMLDFVAEQYAHVLGPTHQAFVADFHRLDFEAQCLYVRLVNRKGIVFAANRLKYPELGDIGSLLETLDEQGWTCEPAVEHVPLLLAFMKRDELLAALRPRFTGIKTTMKKAELQTFALEYCEPEELLTLLPTKRIVVQDRAGDIRYLLFLYFGRIREGLGQFTMRDLGIVRTNHFRDHYEPRFNDIDEAAEHYFYASQLAEFENGVSQLQALSDAADEWPEPEHAGSANMRDKLAYRLGQAHERNGDDYAALRLYEKAGSEQCSERVVRLLFRSGQREQAREYLERCLDNPASDAEALFAADMFARKFGGKKTSALTDLLRLSETIEIDESHTGAPENGALAYYHEAGAQAYRVENSLWRTFFGLLFWDLLFSQNSGLHTPFENLPSSLLDRRFYADNKTAVDKRLALLADGKALKKELLKTAVGSFGVPNGVFRWRQSILDALHVMLEHLSADSMHQMLLRYCTDYPDARSGYPDLMLVEQGVLRFVEIKTEGDSLRRNQLLRIEQLRSAGIPADVVKVRWVLDPEQTYVVVDVETTGGKGENHRVTEIGAVKMRDNQVVDRFETLLNPQRSIPTGITRLTGITPAMVADAPYFVDVADKFEAFLEDAIFVAHNVDFDYRFIAQEFNRIGRPFRMPKLCTCASMRRLYPGRKSYSLAALTQDFDIDLKNHHRALCDAEAAAELLMLVNEKRAENLQH